jgi:NADH-quinone oxidoreductase subunit C
MTRIPTPTEGLEGASLTSEQIVERIRARFGDVTAEVAHGELTVHVAPDAIVDLLGFCRDDPDLDCELLADLSGVHWPAGELEIERQPATTGWPTYRVARDLGVIEVLYVLRSVSRNHWLRVATATPDTDPRLPSVTGVFETANFHEREVYDFFGVEFEGHPGLERILMPEDWVGHPHRKDYPLGGVDIPYRNDKFIPPPDERSIRETVR